MDKYLKWIATGFLMIGAACNSLNIYPIGPIATLDWWCMLVSSFYNVA